MMEFLDSANFPGRVAKDQGHPKVQWVYSTGILRKVQCVLLVQQHQVVVVSASLLVVGTMFEWANRVQLAALLLDLVVSSEGFS